MYILLIHGVPAGKTWYGQYHSHRTVSDSPCFIIPCKESLCYLYLLPPVLCPGNTLAIGVGAGVGGVLLVLVIIIILIVLIRGRCVCVFVCLFVMCVCVC